MIITYTHKSIKYAYPVYVYMSIKLDTPTLVAHSLINSNFSNFFLFFSPNQNAISQRKILKIKELPSILIKKVAFSICLFLSFFYKARSYGVIVTGDFKKFHDAAQLSHQEAHQNWNKISSYKFPNWTVPCYCKPSHVTSYWTQH